VTSVLRVEQVSKTFGRFFAVKNVSLSVAAGERRAVIGPNGAGKSTLFNIIAGQVAPSAGRIHLDGIDTTGAAPDRMFAYGLTRTFQRNQLFQGLNVWDNVQLACAARPGGKSRGRAHREAIVADVAETLHQVHLSSQAARMVKDLAYGEQRQLELALALAGRPKLLLLDEPTAGMSPTETEAMLALMQGLSRDITLLIVEHDMDVVFNLADTITVLHLGEVLAEGAPSVICVDERVIEVYMGRRGKP
jgi:branched-chain amino acid transport system ATP-binding protein